MKMENKFQIYFIIIIFLYLASLKYVISQSLVKSEAKEYLFWDSIIADVNNDGVKELVVADQEYPFTSQNSISLGRVIVFSYINGNYSPIWEFRFSYDEPSGHETTIYVGDVDSDGENELIISNSIPHDIKSGGKLRIFEYQGSNTWKEVWSELINESIVPGAIKVGDVDNDGKNEMVVGISYYTRKLRVYEYKGNNNYSVAWSTYNSGPQSILIGDCDNDSQNEIICMSYNDIKIYKYVSGSYSEVWNFSWQNIYRVSSSIGDLDNDGKNEILVALLRNGYEGSVRIFKHSSENN